MKIVVLGAGLIGHIIAKDLATDNEFDVTAVDIDEQRLQNLSNIGIKTIKKNLSENNAVQQLVKDYDIVVNCVPGHLGFKTLKEIILSGKNVVDIAFYEQDPFELDELAKKNKVVALVDYGVAPGMSHLLTGYAHSQLDQTENVVIYVGGLPLVRTWPYEYKVVFNPYDTISEYLRPAKIVENNKLIEKEALSEVEKINFKKVGTLEAFNSDGARTLLKTIKATNIKEKTLRYPGYTELMKILRFTGFFDHQKLDIKGQKISPIDVTAKLLFPKWQMGQKDQDITIMRICVDGQKNGENVKYTFDLYDVFDKKGKNTSMARCTGYSATMGVRLLARGLYKEIGINPPEYVGKNQQCVHFTLKGLRERNIVYKEKVDILNATPKL